MISLVRTRSKQAIHPNFRGKKRKEFNRELLLQEQSLLQGLINERKFVSTRWKAAKKQLFIETKGKCAYCEANTQVVAHDDVEHYRPKSIYWWLAYCYENYLVSCAICNEVYKRDQFPTKKDATVQGKNLSQITDQELEILASVLNPDPFEEAEGLGFNEFKEALQKEEALLINPYLDNPEDFFAYEADEVLREVSIVPVHPGVKEFVEASVDIYGLNRPELLDLRFRVFAAYDVYRLTLEDEGINLQTRLRNKMAIEIMKQPDALFSGMIRYFDRLNFHN